MTGLGTPNFPALEAAVMGRCNQQLCGAGAARPPPTPPNATAGAAPVGVAALPAASVAVVLASWTLLVSH